MTERIPTSADVAVNHVLRTIQRDGRLAYLLGYGTESFALLTRARAEFLGEQHEEFAKHVWGSCRPERVILDSSAY